MNLQGRFTEINLIDTELKRLKEHTAKIRSRRKEIVSEVINYLADKGELYTDTGLYESTVNNKKFVVKEITRTHKGKIVDIKDRIKNIIDTRVDTINTTEYVEDIFYELKGSDQLLFDIKVVNIKDTKLNN